MAESILHNSPPKESNKTESNLNSENCPNESRDQSPEIINPIRATEEIPLIIKGATICFLPGNTDYSVGILLETIVNLSRLHEELTKLQEMMAKGGAL
jgi:hypothetical protein